MIDIETLDNKAGAVITQIGAANFDRETGKILSTFSTNVDAASCQKLGMTIGADTVMWWFAQSNAAMESLCNPIPVPVAEALNRFRQWTADQRKALDDRILIWCHASFDFPILSRAFEICNLVVPWGYTHYRDIRTVVDLAGLDLKQYRMAEGQAHNALQDTLNQVKYTADALRIIRSSR